MTKDYAIKTGQYLSGFGEPVIVTWAFIPEVSRPAFYQAGFAIFVPATYFFRSCPGRMEISPGASSNAIPNTTELLQVMDQQAASQLEHYVGKTDRALHAARFSDRSYRIIESEVDPLLQFRLNGLFGAEILVVYQQTECVNLKDHLLKIMSTPRKQFGAKTCPDPETIATGDAVMSGKNEVIV
jgi:hypothetical protein